MTAIPRIGRTLRPSLFLLAVCLFLQFTVLATDVTAQTSLEGRVVDPQQRPVANATIVAISPLSAARTVRTDSEGRFAIDQLRDDRYDITASAPGLIGEARDVAPGTATIEIELRVSAVTETLVVSASQADQPLSRTADVVTVITGDDIASRQITSLGEALNTLPGFTVARSGGPGTLTSLFPRGGESDYTLVLVDGVRANAFGGGADLSQIAVEDVDRIEVVRGPQSALFGSDAIGGVVQIVTRSGGEPSARGRIETGSRATRRVAGSTTGALNGWQWQAGGDYFEDEGFSGLAPANGERVTNDDARENQAWVGGGYRSAQGSELQTTLRFLETERGAPGPFGSNPAGNFFGVDHVSRGTTERTAFQVRVLHPFGGPAGRVRQRVEFDVADYDLTFLSSAPQPSKGETRRVHGRIQTDTLIRAGLSASAGLEWLGERGASSFIVIGQRPDQRAVPVERRVIGTFGELRWSNDRFSIQGGARAEHIKREPLATNASELAVDTVVSVNPKVTVSWLLGPQLPSMGAHVWTRVHASAGTGIRPPDIFEIAFTDNPGLKPERSKSVDVGVTQVLAGGRVQLDATTFFNEYDDLIIAVGRLSGVSRFRTDNISNARARGIELASTWRGTRALALRASYTFLDTEIRGIDGLQGQTQPPFHVGDPLLRRPTHQGSFGVTWTASRATIFGSLQARGETLDAEPNFGTFGGLFPNDGHAVLDAGASMRIVRGIDVYGRVLNLFDRHYEEVLGYPAPGRTAFVGVRFAASR